MHGMTWSDAAAKTPFRTAAIVVLTVVAYVPALRAGFIWNDESVGSLLGNIVFEADGLFRVWFTTESLNYWPMVWTSFWVEHQIWGFNPAGYHAVNILVHAASALLVWRLLRDSPAEHRPRGLDLPGSVLLFGMLFSLVLAVNRGDNWGWGSPVIVALFVGQGADGWGWPFTRPWDETGLWRVPRVLAAGAAGGVSMLASSARSKGMPVPALALVAMISGWAAASRAISALTAVSSAARSAPASGPRIAPHGMSSTPTMCTSIC